MKVMTEEQKEILMQKMVKTRTLLHQYELSGPRVIDPIQFEVEYANQFYLLLKELYGAMNVMIVLDPPSSALTPNSKDEIPTATYQLTVSGIANLEKGILEDCIKLLQILSKRYVSIGYVCLYAYFDTLEQASLAGKALESVVPCQVEIREGEFNVSSLVIENRSER
jgi:hypothetical protein